MRNLARNNDLVRQESDSSHKHLYTVLDETRQMKGQTVKHTVQKRWEINIMKGYFHLFPPSLNLLCFLFPCCNSRRLHDGWKDSGMKVRWEDISLTVSEKSFFRK
jgi:hypothetical protein